MASTLNRTITNVLKSYSKGSAGLVALIPPMLDHIAEHGDYSSTIQRVLNAVEKKDAQRIRAITVACIGEKTLSMAFDKESDKWNVKWGKNGRAGFYLNDNACAILADLAECNTRLHSPDIDATLFDTDKTHPVFDLDKRAKALVSKAFKEGIPSGPLMEAITKQIQALANEEPVTIVETREDSAAA